MQHCSTIKNYFTWLLKYSAKIKLHTNLKIEFGLPSNISQLVIAWNPEQDYITISQIILTKNIKNKKYTMDPEITI